jgi:hypothetical protein
MKRNSSGKFQPRTQSEPPTEQPPSPLAEAVAAAIAKFEPVEPGPNEVRELARQAHYRCPELHNYEPAEEQAGRQDFADKVTACRDVLKRFESLITPGRENEAMVLLPAFVDAALDALVTINWRELDRQFNLLITEGNRLSHPPPPKPLDQWLRLAANLGWSGEELAMIEVDLHRDNSYTLSHLDTHGFVTDTGRRVNRLQLRQDHAPIESPWRERFFEKMPPIRGEAQ